MTREIFLTKGYIALVDDEDFDFLNQWKWVFSKGYAYRSRRKNDDPSLPKTIYMHRVILEVGPGLEVDHINRIGTDNRRTNLRKTDRSLNQININLQKNNTSGYRGVSWAKGRGKWNANIYFYNKRRNLGWYSSKEEAALAYNTAALELHGEFANLNILLGR